MTQQAQTRELSDRPRGVDVDKRRAIIEAARHLYLAAARKKDAGERGDLEAAMAKLFASEMCARATLDAIEIHGGYGYTDDFDVERYYRDAPLFTVGEGTNEILRTLIAKQLVRRSG